VNIAARLESIAEAGDVAISTSAYLCLDQNQAKVFNNCGKQTLKNIATPIEVWSTGRLNVGSKGMDRDNKGPLIAIKPFIGAGASISSFAEELTTDLAKYLDQKDWIDSLIQQNPSEDDYQLVGNVTSNGPNFDVDVVLKAPGGKTLWSGNTGGPLSQIALVSDTVADQISNATLLEILKVRDKYKRI
jgi:hypothetical protein